MERQKWKEKIRRLKTDQIIIGILAGILVLVLTIPTEDKTEETEPVQAETKADEENGDYVRQLERRLEEVLGAADGVGTVKVLISEESGGQLVVEKDHTVQEQKEGGAEEGGDIQNYSSSEETVYQRSSDGLELPYVTEEIRPKIRGVLVAAEGGDDPVIIRQITDAVQALFGIEVNKIKVMKLK